MSGHWEVEGEEYPRRFFAGYEAVYAFMEYDGSDTDFYVTLPEAEDLEEVYGWHFPRFIAQGQVRSGELLFVEMRIPEHACEIWADLSSYDIEHPDTDTYTLIAAFHDEYGIEEEDDEEEW